MMLEKIKITLKNNLYFVLPLLLFFIVSIFLIINFKKEDSIIMLNNNLHPYLDILQYLTHIGDGLFWILVVIILSLKNFRKSFILFLSGIISALITQILKLSITSNYRPFKYFKEKGMDISLLNLVEGVEIKEMNSFPSGHSTMAFCTFFMIALFSKNNYVKLGCFVVALISAYSRVYLYQHFLEDIVMGAFIGSLVTFIIFNFSIENKYLEIPFFKKNIVNIFNNVR